MSWVIKDQCPRVGNKGRKDDPLMEPHDTVTWVDIAYMAMIVAAFFTGKLHG